MSKQATLSQKTGKLQNLYFGVSDNPMDDVNPFPSTQAGFANFLASTVGDLRWGTDPDVRKRSKARFAVNFHNVLSELSVKLAAADILDVLEDDTTTNTAAARAWAKIAVFPPLHS